MPLRDRRINIFLKFGCLVASGGLDIIYMIFHDFTPKNYFSKHKNKAEFKCLDNSEVLSSDFPGLKISAASKIPVASTASMTSMTSTVSFHQKFYRS
jgi:hypothetical protein